MIKKYILFFLLLGCISCQKKHQIIGVEISSDILFNELYDSQIRHLNADCSILLYNDDSLCNELKINNVLINDLCKKFDSSITHENIYLLNYDWQNIKSRYRTDLIIYIHDYHEIPLPPKDISILPFFNVVEQKEYFDNIKNLILFYHFSYYEKLIYNGDLPSNYLEYRMNIIKKKPL